MLLGKAQLESGEPIGAEESFVKALKLGIDRSEVAVPMAQALLDQGKFAAVLERFPAESAPPGQRAELLVIRGHAFRGQGDVKSAAAAFEAARSADPRSVSVILATADLYARSGRWGESEKLVEEGLRFAPDDAGLLTMQGTMALVRSQPGEGACAYGKALAAKPDHVPARIARASLLVDLGRTDAATPDVMQLGKERPTDPRVNRLRAAYFTKRGDQQAARDALREVATVIDAIPRDSLRQREPELLFLAGVAHAELRDRQKARAYLEEYLKIEPRHAGARKALGSVLLAQGETLAALSMLEEAKRLSPGDPETLALLAAAYSSRRQYQSATSALEEAIRISGGAPAMHAQMGMGLLQQGRTELGVEHLERSLARNPAQVQAAMALAVAYVQRGEARKAVEVAERLVKAEPKNVAAHNLLGLSRAAAHDAKGARAAYEKAVELDKTFSAARLNLARLDTAEGQYDAARARLNALLKDRPNDVQAMLELATTEEAAGRTAEAVRWLEKTLAIQNRNEVVVTRLVDLYLRGNETDKALAVAKDAEALAPENPAILGALARALIAVGDSRTAQTVLSRMSRLAGTSPAALVQVAQLQLLANDVKGAAYSGEKALAARPDFLPAQTLMAEIDIRGGNFAKAEQRGRAIVASHTSSPLGHRVVADAALAQKNYTQAIASYGDAFKKDPSTESALRLYRAYLLSGAPAKGVEFMQGWIKQRPDDVVAVRALAEGQLAAGNLAAARAGYEAVLKRTGEDPVLLNNLANVLARQGDQAALDYAERAYRLAPTEAAIQDTLGWILVEQGRAPGGAAAPPRGAPAQSARPRDPLSPRGGAGARGKKRRSQAGTRAGVETRGLVRQLERGPEAPDRTRCTVNESSRGFCRRHLQSPKAVMARGTNGLKYLGKARGRTVCLDTSGRP